MIVLEPFTDYLDFSLSYSAHNTVPFELALDVVCQFAGSVCLPLPGLVEWEVL